MAAPPTLAAGDLNVGGGAIRRPLPERIFRRLSSGTGTRAIGAWQPFDQAQGLEQVPQPWNASKRPLPRWPHWTSALFSAVLRQQPLQIPTEDHALLGLRDPGEQDRSEPPGDRQILQI